MENKQKTNGKDTPAFVVYDCMCNIYIYTWG